MVSRNHQRFNEFHAKSVTNPYLKTNVVIVNCYNGGCPGTALNTICVRLGKFWKLQVTIDKLFTFNL